MIRTGTMIHCWRCGHAGVVFIDGECDEESWPDSPCLVCGGRQIVTDSVLVEREWDESGLWFWFRRRFWLWVLLVWNLFLLRIL